MAARYIIKSWPVSYHLHPGDKQIAFESTDVQACEIWLQQQGYEYTGTAYYDAGRTRQAMIYPVQADIADTLERCVGQFVQLRLETPRIEAEGYLHYNPDTSLYSVAGRQEDDHGNVQAAFRVEFDLTDVVSTQDGERYCTIALSPPSRRKWFCNPDVVG